MTLEFELSLYEWSIIIYALRSYAAHNREQRENVDQLCEYINDKVQSLIDFYKITPA